MVQLYSYFAASFLLLGYLLLFFSVITLLFERKFIAIAQKRLGISFLGRNGWIHLPADMVKFWFKYSGRHSGNWLTTTNSSLVVLVGFFCWNILSCCFFLSDGGNVFFDDWDYQLLVYFGYANITTIYMFNIVIAAKSKFATIASIRILFVSIFLEVFFAVCFLLIYLHTGGYAFDEIAAASDRTGWLLQALPPLALFFGIYTLFEAKRAPFDHPESESELVSGHLIEFGGRLLLFFYFSEYIHAYFCMFLILVLVLGGAGMAPLSIQPLYFLDLWFFCEIF